jgi:hypothetical protein
LRLELWAYIGNLGFEIKGRGEGGCPVDAADAEG